MTATPHQSNTQLQPPPPPPPKTRRVSSIAASLAATIEDHLGARKSSTVDKLEAAKRRRSALDAFLLKQAALRSDTRSDTRLRLSLTTRTSRVNRPSHPHRRSTLNEKENVVVLNTLESLISDENSSLPSERCFDAQRESEEAARRVPWKPPTLEGVAELTKKYFECDRVVVDENAAGLDDNPGNVSRKMKKRVHEAFMAEFWAMHYHYPTERLPTPGNGITKPPPSAKEYRLTPAQLLELEARTKSLAKPKYPPINRYKSMTSDSSSPARSSVSTPSSKSKYKDQKLEFRSARFLDSLGLGVSLEKIRIGSAGKRALEPTVGRLNVSKLYDIHSEETGERKNPLVSGEKRSLLNRKATESFYQRRETEIMRREEEEELLMRSNRSSIRRDSMFVPSKQGSVMQKIQSQRESISTKVTSRRGSHVTFSAAVTGEDDSHPTIPEIVAEETSELAGIEAGLGSEVGAIENEIELLEDESTTDVTPQQHPDDASLIESINDDKATETPPVASIESINVTQELPSTSGTLSQSPVIQPSLPPPQPRSKKPLRPTIKPDYFSQIPKLLRFNFDTVVNALKKPYSTRTPQETATIQYCLKPLKAFHLIQSDFVFEQLVQTFQVVEYPKQHVVFRQGDDGDAWYVVLFGVLEISMDTWDAGVEKNVVIHMASSGESFGDMALMHRAARSATVTAKSNVILLRVGKEDFDKIVSFTHHIFKKQMRHFLRRYVPLFQRLSDSGIRTIAELTVLKKFGDRSVILEEGGADNCVFIIKSGVCKIYRNLYLDEDDPFGYEPGVIRPMKKVFVGTLGKGSHFNDQLIDDARNIRGSPFTIIADGPVECATLIAVGDWMNLPLSRTVSSFQRLTKMDLLKIVKRDEGQRKFEALQKKLLLEMAKEHTGNPLTTVSDIAHVASNTNKLQWRY